MNPTMSGHHPPAKHQKPPVHLCPLCPADSPGPIYGLTPFCTLSKISCARAKAYPAASPSILQSSILYPLWLRLCRAASLRFNGAPFNCTAAGAGWWDKGVDWKSYNKLIAFTVDANLPGANLYLSRFARRSQTRRAQTLEVRISRVMKSSANSGGGVDAPGTVLDLSRTRQGESITSKERRYCLPQQPQHEMRESSLL